MIEVTAYGHVVLGVKCFLPKTYRSFVFGF